MNKRITDLPAITSINASVDPLPIVDISDTSQAASGTTKKITINQIASAISSSSPAIYSGTSTNPNGVVTALTGSIYFDISNPAVPVQWVKTGTNWEVYYDSFAPGSNALVVDNVAAIKALVPSTLIDGQIILTRGYYTENDGGQGSYIYDSTSAAADNGGTVLAPTSGTGRYLLQIDGVFKIRQFGAKGDGANDDTIAFQNALSVIDNGGKLTISIGRFKITDELIIKSGMHIVGECSPDTTFGTPSGSENSSFIFQATASKYIFKFNQSQVTNVYLSDLILSSTNSPSVTPSANKNGILISGTAPNQTTRVAIFERILFYCFNVAINVEAVGGPVDYNACPVSLNDCNFFCNSTGIRFNTVNADQWVLTNCGFNFSSNNSTGVYCVRSGLITMINCAGGGIVSPAPSNSYWFYQNSTERDVVKFINCQAENCTAMIYVDSASTPDQYRPLVLDACSIEAPIFLNKECRYISNSCRYTEDVNITANNVVIESFCDSFLNPATQGYKFQAGLTGSYIRNAITSKDSAFAGVYGTIFQGSQQHRLSSAPASGTWKVGDIVWNSSPAIGSNLGWVCTVAGTPGTWIVFGRFDGSSFLSSSGSSSAPSFSNNSDTDTGSYFPSANTYSISTGGSQRMTWDSSGNCGLGTGTPTTGSLNRQLTINSGASNLAGIVLQNNTTGAGAADGTLLFINGLNATLVNYESGSLVISTGSYIEFFAGGSSRCSIKSNGQVRFMPLASDPAGAEEGDVYYNSTSKKLKCYNGTTWNDLF